MSSTDQNESFLLAFLALAGESYPRLVMDDPDAYRLTAADEASAQDEYRTELAQAIEGTLTELGIEADEPEDSAPFYELVDERLPRLADWITSD